MMRKNLYHLLEKYRLKNKGLLFFQVLDHLIRESHRTRNNVVQSTDKIPYQKIEVLKILNEILLQSPSLSATFKTTMLQIPREGYFKEN